MGSKDREVAHFSWYSAAGTQTILSSYPQPLARFRSSAQRGKASAVGVLPEKGDGGEADVNQGTVREFAGAMVDLGIFECE